ncbi:hypothetical protein L873DRAFT_1841938 [Choiromyces venosus 120613-1]|uniref:Uncharacterized protein n=1 Tax=Choiromyces venosus 120613-1 TaxID=1336337 RepID=A0A3N4JYT9_9PEZI|nr:hypothetical protein L873DRAFT_1841938 [Choiromyces venosus 120613-1]
MPRPQSQPIADIQRTAKQKQKQGEVRDGRVQKSGSKGMLAGSMRSRPRQSRAVPRQVSSQFHIPQPHDSEDGRHDRSAADESVDSQDGEYENGTQSEETAEELIESGGDDLLGDYGVQRVQPMGNEFVESQPSTLSFAVTQTQRPGIRIGLPGRKTPAPRVSRTRYIEVLEPSSPAGSVAAPTPIQGRSGTAQEEHANPQLIASRRNLAVGVELTIQTKARELMWDWTLFVDPLPDPVTLTERVNQCWSDARCELGLPNFADTTTSCNDQIRAKHSSCRSQYLHGTKRAVTGIYKLETDDPTACAERVEYLLERDRFNCALTGYETGVFTDNIHFNRASCKGKLHLSPYEKGALRNYGRWANETYHTVGLLERQLHTWANTPGDFQNMILGRIKGVLEARIVKASGMRVERTEGYSNNSDALRREFGINSELVESQRTENGAGNRGRDRVRRSQAEDAQPGVVDQSPAVGPDDEWDLAESEEDGGGADLARS